MRNGPVDYRYLHEVLLGVLHALRNGGGNFAGLAQPVAYHAVFVAYHNNRGKAECTTALRHFRDALYAHEPVLELEVARSYFLYVGI